MSASFKIEGFEDIFDMLDEMETTEQDKRRALNKAGDILKNSIEPSLSKRTGKLQKSVKKNIKRFDGEIGVMVHAGKFYDVFEEFGTSFASHNVGAFEKAVDNVAEEVVETVIKELLK